MYVSTVPMLITGFYSCWLSETCGIVLPYLNLSKIWSCLRWPCSWLTALVWLVHHSVTLLQLRNVIIIDYLWLSMIISGYPWLSVIIHGYQWLSMVIIYYQWLCMVIRGYQWLSMVIHDWLVSPLCHTFSVAVPTMCNPWLSKLSGVISDYPWLSVASHGYQWLSLVIHGYHCLSMVSMVIKATRLLDVNYWQKMTTLNIAKKFWVKYTKK